MKVLVTGVTGTLGSYVSEILLDQGHEIVGFSRDELKQSLLPRRDGLTLYLGDVRDRDRVLEASRGCDVVIAAAALKRIEMSEEQALEFVRTNIEGVENVLHAQRMNNIRRVILASTDKAVAPINPYGATKMLAEWLTLRNPNNIVCRYGNVIGSRGSVVKTFVDSIKEHGSVSITDKNMTRFWIPIERAAQFVVSQTISERGGLRIPDIGAFGVLDLAKLISETLDIPLKSYEEIGLRSREKLHEQLRSEFEGGNLFSNDPHLQYSKGVMKALLIPVLEELCA